MSKALLAQVAVFAAAMSACASTQGSQRVETSSSYLGGQAAQSQSWISRAPNDPPAQNVAAVSHTPAGQAAQQSSWVGEEQAAPPVPTRLAQDGPSYLGGRAAQPDGWVKPVAKTSNQSPWFAAAQTSSRQH